MSKQGSRLRAHENDALTALPQLHIKDVDDLLLRKEKFGIGTLVTQHKGLNILLFNITDFVSIYFAVSIYI